MHPEVEFLIEDTVNELKKFLRLNENELKIHNFSIDTRCEFDLLKRLEKEEIPVIFDGYEDGVTRFQVLSKKLGLSQANPNKIANIQAERFRLFNIQYRKNTLEVLKSMNESDTVYNGFLGILNDNLLNVVSLKFQKLKMSLDSEIARLPENNKLSTILLNPYFEFAFQDKKYLNWKVDFNHAIKENKFLFV